MWDPNNDIQETIHLASVLEAWFLCVTLCWHLHRQAVACRHRCCRGNTPEYLIYSPSTHTVTLSFTFMHVHTHTQVEGFGSEGQREKPLEPTCLFRLCGAENKHRCRLKCSFEILPKPFLKTLLPYDPLLSCSCTEYSCVFRGDSSTVWTHLPSDHGSVQRCLVWETRVKLELGLRAVV